MYIKDDYNFEDLKKAVWSGAVNTLLRVEEANKEGLLMDHLQEIFGEEEVPTITEVNDYLWHDSEHALAAVLPEEEEDEEDED